MSETAAPKGFDLDAYIGSGELGHLESGRNTLLRAVFDDYTAKHLSETLVAQDQTLKPHNDGRVLLAARVLDTADLRWWLRAFGRRVEVLGPKSLREESRAEAKTMARIYR